MFRTRFSRWCVVIAALAASSAVHEVAYADHDGPAAEQAAQEIQTARDRADAAAQALFDAESQIAVLAIEIASAEQRLVSLEDQVGAMRDSLTAIAVARYTGGGVSSNPLFGSVDDASTHATASVLTSIATGNVMVDVDQFEQTVEELDDVRSDLERRRSAEFAARDDYEQLRSGAQEEIARLQKVEADRLQDAEVQHALERQRREREERVARERAEREARERAEAEAIKSEGAERSGGGSSATVPTPPATAPPPKPASGLACPVNGAVGFSDTWGAPRSGGRRHQGVDMIAAGGTPLVAMEDGKATFKTNRLGGNTVSLAGASGTRYYYAHLSSWEGASRSVSRGEVIGYVGKTGNTTVDHLHLQVHPGGGTATNPYPYARRAC